MATRGPRTADELATVKRSLQQLVPKRDRVKAALRAFILDLPAGAALPSILALREQFAASQHLIDRVIGDLRAEGLLETRPGSGTYVAPPAKTLTIGILSELNLFARESGFFGLLAMALHQCARPEELRLRHYFFASAQDATNYDHLEADARAGQLDGLICLGTGGSWVRHLNLPCLDGYTPGWVYLDYRALVRMAVDALAARGRRRIALLTYDATQSGMEAPQTYAEITPTFLAAVSATGADTRPEWLLTLTFDDHSLMHHGYHALHALWQPAGERPDALVCVDDQATAGALLAAETLGLTVPDDLLIASHANSLDPRPDPSQVLRFEFDTLAMARELMARLRTRIAGPAPELADVWMTPRMVPFEGRGLAVDDRTCTDSSLAPGLPCAPVVSLSNGACESNGASR
jgi:DNA-binding LacI/PurR family transcriptional regulator